MRDGWYKFFKKSEKAHNVWTDDYGGVSALGSNPIDKVSVFAVTEVLRIELNISCHCLEGGEENVQR